MTSIYNAVGQLLDDEESLRWAADDWGHLVQRRPRGVLRPSSVQEVVAAAKSLNLVPRGRGHSLGGEAQTDGGIVLDMGSLNAIHEIRSDRVVVDAGARWSAVLDSTLTHGLTPPVLTDYLELSVGGTLSVGGIGGASHRYGLQTDNVLSLEVVTPDGELRTCDPSRNAALFDNVRAGHGRYGTIVRATLRLVPAHERTRRQQLHYTDLATFLADQRRLVGDGRFHYLEGQAIPDESGGWRYVLDTATFHSSASLDTTPLFDDLDHVSAEVDELAHFDFLNRMAQQEEEARALGAWDRPHPWINVFLPDEATDAVVADTLDELTADALGETGVVLLYPFQAGRISTPRLPLPHGPVVFLFALLRTAPPGDGLALDAMVRDNERLRDRAVAEGGTVYLAPGRPE